MKTTLDRLEKYLMQCSQYLSDIPDETLGRKPSMDKWSKKEILGHLVDSAIHNLQRFTEVQFMPKPYKVRPYDQDALVKANYYNQMQASDILKLWLELNFHIKKVVLRQNLVTFAYPVVIGGEIRDLRFLVLDYVTHLEHHVKQILSD